MKISILRILAHAMDVARHFIKMNGEQSAAWDLVRAMLDDPPL